MPQPQTGDKVNAKIIHIDHLGFTAKAGYLTIFVACYRIPPWFEYDRAKNRWMLPRHYEGFEYACYVGDYIKVRIGVIKEIDGRMCALGSWDDREHVWGTSPVR